MYRRIVVPEPGKLRLESAELTDPGPGQVVLRVAAATICHTDHYLVGGTHPHEVTYPVVPGHEIAGTVELMGGGVEHLAVGMSVAVRTLVGCNRCRYCLAGNLGRCAASVEIGSMIDGGWQDFITVPAESARPASPSLSGVEVALTEPSANAHAVVRSADIVAGAVVVIIGPGPIGLLTMQYALLRDPAAVIIIGAADTSPARLDLAAALGASLTFAADRDEAQAFVADATQGLGADVVLQCAGSIEATRLALDVAGMEGQIVVEGVIGHHATIPLAPDLLVERSLRLRGVRGWTAQDFDAALSINGTGRIDLTSIISHELDLADYERAWGLATDEGTGALKVAFVQR